jgi:two-component system CheB/CheR fusion protein
MTRQKSGNGELAALDTRLRETVERPALEAGNTATAGRDAGGCAGARSRSIAATIHDLRQPLQTIRLLQGTLAGRIADKTALKLVESLATPLAAISATLDGLSDIFRPDSACLPQPSGCREPSPPPLGAPPAASILLIEDDPAVAETLDLILTDEGYEVAVAADGWKALELTRETAAPDIIIADYNLPDGLNGLQTIITLRETFRREIPGLILTGGVSSDALREIGDHRCVCLAKPARMAELTDAVRNLIQMKSPAAADEPVQPGAPDDGGDQRTTVFIVDDDATIREAAGDFLAREGFKVKTFADGPAFFEVFRPGIDGCVLVDALMPGMDGFEFIEHLKAVNDLIPAIMITGAGDVPMAVRAMKAGAADFVEKPISSAGLLSCIRCALNQTGDVPVPPSWREAVTQRFGALTARQREVMALILNGQPNKTIATRLGLSQRTVENHRAAIMRKFGANSVAALVRIALGTT